MISIPTFIALALVFPLLALVTNYIFRKHPNLRDGLTLLAAIATFISVVNLLIMADMSVQQSYRLLTVLPGLEIAFKLEPLGMVFAAIASSLWIVTHIYGLGYMRGNNEKHHARFFACFCLAISATLGIAFAGNMFTLFLFYEVLTISTYPLVAHKGNEASKKGARTYLGILIGTSVGFQLLAILWTYAITGTLDFTKGGILEGHIEGFMVAILLALYAFGIGKAALMPFHRWLPAAMVAPTPVSALLHAVAVVKAGVFTMLKVGIYIFGIDFLARTSASTWLMWLAAFSILAASIIAMRKDNLKARLAYSTISQLSYITLGMALATQMGALGGGIHIAMHAFGKITLFMCAGAIYVATHKTNISQMDGLGRKMPGIYFAFFIGALSIIGLPPFGGSWSKYLLMLGAADSGQIIMIVVLMASSLLNVAYLLPIVGRGFFSATPVKNGPLKNTTHEHDTDKTASIKTPILCLIPPLITAFGCLLLFFYADDILKYLEPIVQ